MKLALILLSICVAMSHQQYFHPRMMMGYPWMSPFAQHPHPMYFNNYMGQYPYMGQANRYVNNAQARVKGYEPLPEEFQVPAEDGEEIRFFSGSTIGNPLLKTVTFTITSTCTALSVTTCVAIANLSPNPIACAGRRRRFAEYNDEQGEDIGAQYPIIPSEVRIVMPTAEPSTGLARDSRESPFGISSSIEENSNDSDGNAKQFRDKRFFNWNAFATGVTVTSWSIVSSTFTSTLAIPGVSTVLPCLPAGYGICQIAVGK
ncbi:uncharacterized protein LOC124316501 [Daphnia pulicaria]|uniref:uncharacterized protein LOC124316501 n=1 Tax=Daphnia pulicaria TaxID=35523 RepID=UPI001EEA4CF5|nr:uncharacterized protein LOC124316501 [Daphnia pulicaria]